MNFALYIARRIILNPKHTFSKQIIRIGIIAVALGMTVMIVGSSLIAGFKEEIKEKVYGFWGHIHIMDYEAMSSNTYESAAIPMEQDFYPSIADVTEFKYINKEGREQKTKGGIKHIQVFAQKIGVIKTKKEIEGIILKGIGPDFDWTNLKKFIKQGESLNLKSEKPEKDIILSEQTAKRLQLGVGDQFLIFFVKGESQIKKKFKIKGIYRTGLEEYDTKFAIIDIRHIQKLNNWTDAEVSGFELFVDDIQEMTDISNAIYDALPMNMYASTIQDIDPNIFGWLSLQDTTERIILILMLIVSVISMITAFIILVLERTNMIGVLKALGASNTSVQGIFLTYGLYITFVGLLIGNILGFGLCFIQDYFGLIQLSEEDYYVSVAPIKFRPLFVMLLNLGVLFTTFIALLLPSLLVNRVSPVKAVRFK